MSDLRVPLELTEKTLDTRKADDWDCTSFITFRNDSIRPLSKPRLGAVWSKTLPNAVAAGHATLNVTNV